MKRQANIGLILSAAVMMSAGVSMTSFADSGWLEENGGWVYYGENGEKVTEEWIKSGAEWFWLDSSGQMAAGQLLEIENNYYYLQQDGTMAHDKWISLDNENSDQEDEPEQYWYYFSSSGKAYKRKDSVSSGNICAREIDGEKYAFDTEGRMLFGWASDGERQTGEDAWKDSNYYFGSENDGAMRVDWEKITIETDFDDEMMPDDGIWDDEEQGRWFYFSPSGKKVKGRPDKLIKKTIGGQKFGFDEYGRMISAWYASPDLITTKAYDKTLSADENLTERQGGSQYTKEFMYFGSPESGAQYNQGWFRARPSRYLMESKHLDHETYMYFADGDGNLYANEIRSIDGEKYAFDNYGRLINGLVCLTMTDETTSDQFESAWYQDKSGREFSNEDEFNDLIDYHRFNGKGDLVENYRYSFDSHKMRFYYFGGPNSSMLTGKQNVKVGDETVEFMFETSGHLKGSGLCGKKDGKLYQAGWLLKADQYEKYVVVKLESKEEKLGTSLVKYKMLTEMTAEDFIDEVCNSGVYNEETEERVWTVRRHPDGVEYYLINQNGDIVKNKKNAKDIDGFEFHVKDSKILNITAEE